MLSRLKKERTKLREIELKQDKETRNTIENLYFDLKKRLQGLESEELTYVERIKLAKEIKSVVNHVIKREYIEDFYRYIDSVMERFTNMENNYLSIKEINKGNGSYNDCFTASNCMHIWMSYVIWNKKDRRFDDPLAISNKLKSYYKKEVFGNVGDGSDKELAGQNDEMRTIEGIRIKED